MFSAKFIVLAITAALVSADPVQVQRRAASNVFPSPPTTSSLSSAIKVGAGQTFNPPKAFTRYDRGSGACSGQTEGGESDAVFILENGATLNNVVIGKNQAEGIHCKGSCTLNNVWWEDVCEDAVTIKQTSGTSRINGGGAKGASDKIVQHNGGGKVIISNFYAENFGKLYRSCGNCKTQYKRDVEILDSWAVKGSNLVGINTNYGDTATIRRTKVSSVSTICQKFTGNNSGAEPSKNGSGPDGKNCLYTNSDILS
ncbi:pectate lyase C [Panaeolus papilionaceus]|nr:pectate lyase C [Panaeolus papilionaceus]